MVEEKPQNEVDVKDLQECLILAEKERDEYLAGWKRAKADLVNFKRETAEVMGGITSSVRAEVFQVLLPVLDAFDKSDGAGGLKNIADLFRAILKKEGVEVIEANAGDEFSPEIHEAVEGEGGVISEVLQKGYKFKEQIIRPVKVRVK